MLLRTAIFAFSDKHLFLTIDQILFEHFKVSPSTFPSLANILSRIQVHLLALVFHVQLTTIHVICLSRTTTLVVKTLFSRTIFLLASYNWTFITQA